MRTCWVLSLWVLLVVLLASYADGRSIHVFVALADNEHQGIVPVPETLGNGDDARNNLYWGALYGVKTFFRKSANWELLTTDNDLTLGVLERCVFRHKVRDVLFVADAYQGAEIKRAVTDFLSAAAGSNSATLEVSGRKVSIHGGADLVVYVGHNGLMDFSIAEDSIQARETGCDAIVLACRSKPYFQPWLLRLNAQPVLLTTGLMAPEAYTLEAAVEGWIARESGEQIRERAATAYDKYQKCGMNGARRLFFSGLSPTSDR